MLIGNYLAQKKTLRGNRISNKTKTHAAHLVDNRPRNSARDVTLKAQFGA